MTNYVCHVIHARVVITWQSKGQYGGKNDTPYNGDKTSKSLDAKPFLDFLQFSKGTLKYKPKFNQQESFNCPPITSFSSCHTSHSLWLETVNTHCCPPPPNQWKFLQLVIAHHGACNVTFVSWRQAASLSSPRWGKRQSRALCCERENEKERDWDRGVLDYNQIPPLHHHSPKPVRVWVVKSLSCSL